MTRDRSPSSASLLRTASLHTLSAWTSAHTPRPPSSPPGRAPARAQARPAAAASRRTRSYSRTAALSRGAVKHLAAAPRGEGALRCGVRCCSALFPLSATTSLSSTISSWMSSSRMSCARRSSLSLAALLLPERQREGRLHRHDASHLLHPSPGLRRGHQRAAAATAVRAAASSGGQRGGRARD